MEIIIMRHGKPGFTDAKKIAASEMHTWIARYDLSDIRDNQPPEACREIVRKVKMTVSSQLPRAISSAATLKLEPEIMDDIFREAELPVYRIPLLKLPPFIWITLFRLIWLCGMSKEAESFSMAKKRARQAASILLSHAKEDKGPILLMGHGIINRLIAKELKSLNWKENARAGKGYWSASIFQFP